MAPRSSLVSAVLAGASLTLAPSSSFAGPGPQARVGVLEQVRGPAEGPLKPPAEPDDSAGDEAEAPASLPSVLPPPSIDPTLMPEPEPEPGIEFAVPPPGAETEPEPPKVEPGYIAEFPDPGTAPNDGHSILALSGTTIALTGIGFTTGLIVGLQSGVALEWLLPATIVPTVGLLAFSGGGLYLGIKRAQKYRRWEAGYRVIGTPQGGALLIGGSFGVLAALGFISAGSFQLRNGQTEFGATMLAIAGAAAVATPIMFTLGNRYKADYQRTGGWRRRPVPPLPPGADGTSSARLQLIPMLLPLPDGVGLGAAGRF